jgi:hypothetical protein
VTINAQATTSAVIDKLTANTTYYVRIMATGTGAYSDSDYSTAKSATTPGLDTITMPNDDVPHDWTTRISPSDNNILQIVDLNDNSVLFSYSIDTLEQLVITSSGTVNDSLTIDFSNGAFRLDNGIQFNGHAETFDTLYFIGSDGDDSIVLDGMANHFNDLPVYTQNIEHFILDGGTGNDQALVIGTESGNTFNMSDELLLMVGGGYRWELGNFKTIDAIAFGRNDRTYIYAENDSLIVMNDIYVEQHGHNQLYRVWYSKQVTVINMDDSNNAILHTGSRGYDVFTLSQNYSTATNAVGSYSHEIINFKNVNISTSMSVPTVSLPTANGWTPQEDRGVWAHNGLTVSVMGNANVTARDGSTLPQRMAAAHVETLVMETPTSNDETLMTPTAFETILQPESILPFDTALMPDVVPSVAKLETPFVHDHFDENWYALLAELHVQEQRKKDKWHGENGDDDWLAEFEKLALLDLRK